MMNVLPVIPAAFYLFGFYRGVFIYAGFIVHAGYMLYRGIQLGRLPIIGPHDTLYFLSVSTVLFGLPMTFGLKHRLRHLFPVLGLSIFFVLLSLFYAPHNSPLPPVLKTFWFEAHVTLSFFSYALFGIAAVFGMTFIIFRGSNTGNVPDADDVSTDNVEVLQYKAILVGYCLFSAAMVFGGIWAYLAWGTYWLWTPKELWTVILWLFYSLYLHARLRQWWSGKPSAVLGIIGFVIVMFTYLGVSLFMKSSHTF
jgi:cytochrome c-type biogenesis protein CcsB